MKVIAAKNFVLNGTPFIVNNEIEIKDKKILMQLNDKGFIRPLTKEQIESLEERKTYENRKFRKEEEEIIDDRRYYKN